VSVYRFQEVSVYGEKRGACPACGKSTVRKQKFTNTINPYNVNEAGLVKSYDEVRADVIAERDAWSPDFRHDTVKCEVSS
jgi:hypothetical protein